MQGKSVSESEHEEISNVENALERFITPRFVMCNALVKGPHKQTYTEIDLLMMHRKRGRNRAIVADVGNHRDKADMFSKKVFYLTKVDGVYLHEVCFFEFNGVKPG